MSPHACRAALSLGDEYMSARQRRTSVRSVDPVDCASVKSARADTLAEFRFCPLEVLFGPRLDRLGQARILQSDSAAQKPGPVQPDVARDNPPDTKCRFGMDSEAVSQGIERDLSVPVVSCVPANDGLGREKPHLHRQSRPVKVRPGCWRKLLAALAALKKISLRQRVDRFSSTCRARDPHGPAGVDEAISAGDFVRKGRFDATFRQLQIHRDTVQVRHQIRMQINWLGRGSDSIVPFHKRLPSHWHAASRHHGP